MSEKTDISFGGASIGGVNIDSTVHGNQIGTQHNYAPEQKQNLAGASQFYRVSASILLACYGTRARCSHYKIMNLHIWDAPNLAEAAAEIQQLLEQLQQTNPTTTEAQLIVNQAIERQPLLKDPQIIEQAIKTTPSLKARLRSAGEAAYIETVKVLLPPVGVAIEH